jgi:MFS family permease
MSESEPSRNIPNQQKRGIRFWLIIVSLAITAFLVALEATIVSTALPSIISDLGGYGAYVWVIMAFFLTTTAFQPLYGQLADIFGRRYPTIFAVAIFAIGCGLCGGAHNIGMMIAGRTIQGIGASGINVLSELIICDLVPLRERGNFMAIIFVTMVNTLIASILQQPHPTSPPILTHPRLSLLLSARSSPDSLSNTRIGDGCST